MAIETQRQILLARAGVAGFEREFKDEGLNRAVLAASRPGFAALLSFVGNGDTVYVFSVDGLGRDAIDVQTTVCALVERGVTVDVHGLGQMAKGIGELIFAVLSQVADMERRRIKERTAAGRELAVATLKTTGWTHRGKASMGRPVGRAKAGTVDPSAVVAWRKERKASIAATAIYWKLSEATVKRYCAANAAGA